MHHTSDLDIVFPTRRSFSVGRLEHASVRMRRDVLRPIHSRPPQESRYANPQRLHIPLSSELFLQIYVWKRLVIAFRLVRACGGWLMRVNSSAEILVQQTGLGFLVSHWSVVETGWHVVAVALCKADFQVLTLTHTSARGPQHPCVQKNSI